MTTGFTDIHSHGGGGFSFSDPNPEHVARALATHRAHGTTTQIASLVTEPLDVLKAQIKNLIPFALDKSIAGIHLEGPYLSSAKCGAHDPKLLREPKLDEIKELIEAGQGHIRMVTIAPELPGALAAIELLRELGVTVAIGHSNATEAEANSAFSAGASVVTHMFNALPELDHRSGTITNALLVNPDIYFEIILDGVHVNHSAVELLLKLAPGRIILVTDAMSAAGGIDGDYTIGDLAVKVEKGIATLASNGSLAGSTLTMDSAYNRLLTEFKVSPEAAQSAAIDLGKKALGI
jgi:N-acetylglucosamine-6-phosphate deacetylase